MRSEQQADALTNGLVTVEVAGQFFGVPLSRVKHVFVPDRVSPVPLAPPEVMGLLNLRGRIVTALDLRTRLGLSLRVAGDPMVALGVEKGGEMFGLIADKAGEAIWTTQSGIEPAPANLDERWARLCAGVYRLNDGLLTLLDVDRLLDLNHCGVAA
ncbi:chemotaxis protein CheW [Methyloceanibacter caenitepidi]|uniref:Positive regulator of CheA protein activity n=1 Tax=Methyloceanibacter caenitepidi TaxID=1384459 RepID=A0A0A8K5N7_9HYPH|nr:chemotaxis protein CheW [Methyloceanibacter caenitepidi]BAQ18258.1 positive regulator of CheA protein activity [Methyloceanibacter caenitepidi]